MKWAKSPVNVVVIVKQRMDYNSILHIDNTLCCIYSKCEHGSTSFYAATLYLNSSHFSTAKLK